MKKLVKSIILSSLLLSGCERLDININININNSSSSISNNSSTISYENSENSTTSTLIESTSTEKINNHEELIKFLNEIEFKNSVFSFDGKEHSIVINEELPNGVIVEYENNNKINVGEYEVTANFLDNNDNFIIDKKATMNIIKGGLPGVSFQDQTFYYTGEAFFMEISGELPEGVGVSYVGNGQTEVGTYTVIAHFEDVTGNYYVPDLEATMTIEPELKHTVTLVKNNGEEDSTRTIRHGKTFVEPEYEMQYYEIEGWYLEPEC